jgi:2-polyprenyl-3-methyl-5-hydroxy-6-metoxy-1,4-benzoquinol methylase
MFFQGSSLFYLFIETMGGKRPGGLADRGKIRVILSEFWCRSGTQEWRWIMNCAQCEGIEELFGQQYVSKELARYRAKGPDKTTRMLTDAIKQEGVDGLSLLDIGGGVGAIQHELLGAGVVGVTSVEASTAYIDAARAEAQQRGLADHVSYQHGNFVDLAGDIPPADIVTLDRVICCYPDMEKLVGLSAARARKIYGLVYPRDAWWVKIALAVENFFFKLRRSQYRTFAHPTRVVEALVSSKGLKRRSYRRTLVWQVVVYAR